MNSLPINLFLEDRLCVIVGGGQVATRRAAAFLQAKARVNVIAPEIYGDLEHLHSTNTALTLIKRGYQTGDLHQARLVVIATNNPDINNRVAQDANAAGILTNRADAPDQGDLTIPAHAHHGPVTLAVHTQGISASAAAAIRRELSDSLDPDWPRLLTVIAPYRAKIIAEIQDVDHRTVILRRLSGPEAMAAIKRGGEDAVIDFIHRLFQDTDATSA